MIEETLKEIAIELKGIRAALEAKTGTTAYVASLPKELADTPAVPAAPTPKILTATDIEMRQMRASFDSMKIRYPKNATVEQLREKMATNDKKNERIAAAQAKKAEVAPKPTITMDDLKAAIIDFAKKNGKAAAINVLKEFDAAKVSDVAVADYEKFMVKLGG